MIQPDPLISIVIITYNSSKFILETLESAGNQTYRNIELIVSDDCSSDNTIEICQNWIDQNKNKFANTRIILSETNTGISTNLNRGLYASSGKWIKFIAGDDYLFPECIDTFMQEINKNNSIKFIFSNLKTNGNVSNCEYITNFFKLNCKQQYHSLLKSNTLPTPGIFMEREMILGLNGFDEKFKLLEDYPLLLKASKSGIKFYFIDKPLVFYRVHETNISLQQKLNMKYIRDVKLFFQKIYLKELFKSGMILYFLHYLLQYLLLLLSSIGLITKLSTYNSLLSWLSLLSWKLRIQKIFSHH